MESLEFQLLDGRLKAVEAELSAGKERFQRLETAQLDNTDITTQTKLAVDGLSTRVSEPLAYFDRAMMGLKVLGGIGVAGLWVARRWYYLVALVVGFKILASGGSITEAWNSMLRALELATHP